MKDIATAVQKAVDSAFKPTTNDDGEEEMVLKSYINASVYDAFVAALHKEKQTSA